MFGPCRLQWSKRVTRMPWGSSRHRQAAPISMSARDADSNRWSPRRRVGAFETTLTDLRLLLLPSQGIQVFSRALSRRRLLHARVRGRAATAVRGGGDKAERAPSAGPRPG